jgi:hypothetical protein
LRELRDGVTPALRDVLELPVPIELIAKEVAEDDDLRRYALDHGRKHEFVDLEQAKLGTPTLEERRGDTRGKVRTGVIPREPVSLGEDFGRNRARRRLAVGRRDHDAAERQPVGERAKSAGIELPEELAGQGRAAPATREA